MAGLPKKLYYIVISPSQAVLSYGRRGGGKYTHLDPAKKQVKSLRERGHNARLFVTETTWQEVDVEDDV
jgi:hypothetical protein